MGHSIAPSAVSDAVRVSADLVAMPSILLKAGNLTRAVVTVNQCGTATAPLLLGGSLAHVEELILDCVELHAVVPARVTWRNVYVAATHLNLRFEDVASFGEAIPAFCFRFKELQVCYPQPSTGSWPSQSLLHLNCSVVPSGDRHFGSGNCCGKEEPRVDWSLRTDGSTHYQPLTSGMCFPLAQPPSNMWEAKARCCCGACEYCLCAAGIMH